jgi:hypothetical protein
MTRVVQLLVIESSSPVSLLPKNGWKNVEGNGKSFRVTVASLHDIQFSVAVNTCALFSAYQICGSVHYRSVEDSTSHGGWLILLSCTREDIDFKLSLVFQHSVSVGRCNNFNGPVK